MITDEWRAYVERPMLYRNDGVTHFPSRSVMNSPTRYSRWLIKQLENGYQIPTLEFGCSYDTRPPWCGPKKKFQEMGATRKKAIMYSRRFNEIGSPLVKAHIGEQHIRSGCARFCVYYTTHYSLDREASFKRSQRFLLNLD